MTKTSIKMILGASVVTLSLAASGLARADANGWAAPPDRDGITPTTPILFSSSGLGRTGDFSGTIVDLSCDPARRGGGGASCDATEEREFALKLDGERVPYPLL